MYTTRFLDIPPLVRIAGEVRLPGSKSISNRALLLAALCDGTTILDDLLDSDDTRVMQAALRTLGCGVDSVEGGAGRDGIERAAASIAVQGLDGRLRCADAELFLGNAGTAVRPLTAALAVLAATQGGRFVVKGVARMHERPIGDLVDALRRLGCGVDYLGADGYPPLRLRQGERPLDIAAPIRVRGDVSSQFLTALLMALPLVPGAVPKVVEVEGPLISKPYVEITLNLMARFGVTVANDGWRRFEIDAAARYRSPGRLRVEGDASSASYFIAAGAIAATDAPLVIRGVDLGSIQGDIRFVDAARAMGADVRGGDGWLEVRRGTFPLAPLTMDCADLPDAAMTLAAMALFARGTTRLAGIGSWRVKETDRIAAMATELTKCGATVVAGADFLEIAPPMLWQAPVVQTYDDHRIAMCLSLAAFNGAVVAKGDRRPVRVVDPRCVAKTYPDYFEDLFRFAEAAPGAIPVITVDGPTASGKGTLASAVAAALGYRSLDSGALYRATALAALQDGVAPEDEPALAALAVRLPIDFDAGRIRLDGVDVGDTLRHEDIGVLASRISALPKVRDALLRLQLSFRRVPGLVADGRDMGTVVFPAAGLKVFLTASAARRAERRLLQLRQKGFSANIDGLRADLEMRDARDQNRSVSPLRPAEGALLLDNSTLSIEDSVDAVLEAWEQRRPFA